MSSDEPIDWSVLTGLDLGDSLPTLVATFLEHTPALVGELRAAVESDDADAAGAAAHSLKSSARMFGAARLGDLCERVELSGYDGVLDDQSAIAALEEVERVMEALRAFEPD